MSLKAYYEQAGITIYHGDCRQILPGLPPCDAVVSDPPYNCGKKYGTHDDDMAPQDYVEWLSNVWALCDVGTLVYTPGTRNIWDTQRIVNCAGFVAHRLLGWHKKEFAGDKWNDGPAMCWEPVVWAYRERKFCNKLFGAQGRDFLVVNSTHGNPLAMLHPCPKPIEVAMWLVRLFTVNSVLDPFAGTGTTLLAAKGLRRRAIGIEIEEKYCEIAAKRLSQEVLPFDMRADVVPAEDQDRPLFNAEAAL